MPQVIDESKKVQEIIERYQRGETLASIAKRFHVTRQRIQQYTSRYKLTRHNAGFFGAPHQKQYRQEMKEYKHQLKEHRHIEKYGISRKERQKIQEIYTDVNNRSETDPFMIFSRKRNNVTSTHSYRPTKWELTFSDWWKLWQESGKWKQRGRKLHEYTMGRITHTKGFVPGNCIITTNEHIMKNRIYE